MSATEPTTLVIMAGVFGAAMGAVGGLAKWGIASLQSRGGKDSDHPDRRPGGFRSEDHLLLTQVHRITAATDANLQRLAVAINGQLKASLDQERQQTEGIEGLAKEFRSLRLELARGSGGKGDA